MMIIKSDKNMFKREDEHRFPMQAQTELANGLKEQMNDFLQELESLLRDGEELFESLRKLAEDADNSELLSKLEFLYDNLEDLENLSEEFEMTFSEIKDLI